MPQRIPHCLAVVATLGNFYRCRDTRICAPVNTLKLTWAGSGSGAPPDTLDIRKHFETRRIRDGRGEYVRLVDYLRQETPGMDYAKRGGYKVKLMYELSWVPRGMENASRAMFRWVMDPDERESVAMRVGVASAIPLGSSIFIYLSPTFGPTVISVSLLTVCAVFGNEKNQVVNIGESDYEVPYEVQGNPMTSREVLQKFLDENPGMSLEDLALRLSVLPHQLEDELVSRGLPVPQGSHPSPTSEEVPSEPLPDPSPAPMEEEERGEEGKHGLKSWFRKHR